MHVLITATIHILLLLLLPAFSSAAPLARDVTVGRDLYESIVNPLAVRSPPYKISKDVCLRERHGGTTFCAMGKFLCQFQSKKEGEVGMLKWEAVDSPMDEAGCPKDGWRGNSSILKIKIG